MGLNELRLGERIAKSGQQIGRHEGTRTRAMNVNKPIQAVEAIERNQHTLLYEQKKGGVPEINSSLEILNQLNVTGASRSVIKPCRSGIDQE